jgi:hypothetical protein
MGLAGLMPWISLGKGAGAGISKNGISMEVRREGRSRGSKLRLDYNESRHPPHAGTMIVKDEEENLPRSLESIAGLCNELVIVDTESADQTKEIARSFGAKVFDFAWVDSFLGGPQRSAHSGHRRLCHLVRCRRRG